MLFFAVVKINYTHFLMKFNELKLSKEILKSLSEAGYESPTPIQEKSIPLVLENQDVLACAQTGTGKTAAFILPIAQHLLDYPRKSPGFPRVLILSPTRELALQTSEQCTQLTELTDIKTGLITGGVSYDSHIDV